MVGICWGSIFLLKPKKMGNIMTYSLGDPMISWDGTPPRQGTLRNLVVTTISFMVVFNSIRQTTKQTLVNLRWWLMIFFTNSTWCYENLFGRDWDWKWMVFAFFCDKFACPICIFLWEIWCLEWICTSHLHFFAFSVFFAFWKRVEGFIFAFFQIGSVPRKRRAFFWLHFFANLQFPGRTSWESWKNTKKTLGYVQQKCKNELKMENKRKQ